MYTYPTPPSFLLFSPLPFQSSCSSSVFTKGCRCPLQSWRPPPETPQRSQWCRARVLVLESQSIMECGHGWVTIMLLLGFVPALRFLWSQILCRLYRSPSDETINWGLPCAYNACKKITYNIYFIIKLICMLLLKILYCCSPCQSLVNCRNNKITQHALKLVKVSESSSCSSWTLYKRRKMIVFL